jgi:hypothetical protein
VITAHEGLSVIFCDNQVIYRVTYQVISRLLQITLPPFGGYSDNLINNPVISCDFCYVHNNEYMKQHIHNKNIKLKTSDWAPKLIQALWDHMLRLWKYRNDALHKNDMKEWCSLK